jgi:SAM-dependent methyltransferase
MLSTEMILQTFTKLQEVPTLIFDTVTAWGYAPLNQRIISQFRQPTGWLGRLVGHAMSLEHRRVTRWTLHWMNIQPHDHILDIGCGSGMALQLLLEQARDGFVAGVDHAQTMVEQAIQRNQRAVQVGRMDIRQADVLHLPFADNTFDQVCTIETLYFWPDLGAALCEIKRVLKPGGRLAIALEYSKEANVQEEIASFAVQANLWLYSCTELTHLLSGAGFGQIRYQTVPAMAHGWLYIEATK